MKDTARVLSRFYDAIEFRGAGQAIVDALVQFADVPIYNGLTNEIHPTQFLADALTMLEHADKPDQSDRVLLHRRLPLQHRPTRC